MALTTEAKVTTHCAVESAIATKIFVYVDEAENMLRKWIGDDKYDEIEADGSSHDYYTKAQKAESLICYMLALPVLNMRLTEKGGLVKSTGFAESLNQLMGKRELDSYMRSIRSRARQLVRKLLVKDQRIDRPEFQA